MTASAFEKIAALACIRCATPSRYCNRFERLLSVSPGRAIKLASCLFRREPKCAWVAGECR